MSSHWHGLVDIPNQAARVEDGVGTAIFDLAADSNLS